jgi:hypothetical protein
MYIFPGYVGTGSDHLATVSEKYILKLGHSILGSRAVFECVLELLGIIDWYPLGASCPLAMVLVLAALGYVFLGLLEVFVRYMALVIKMEHGSTYTSSPLCPRGGRVDPLVISLPQSQGVCTVVMFNVQFRAEVDPRSLLHDSHMFLFRRFLMHYSLIYIMWTLRKRDSNQYGCIPRRNLLCDPGPRRWR